MEGAIIARENNKNQSIFYEHSIKKSNELSIAKLNQGLSLNQIQLFAYAIYSTQQDGKTNFIKAEFEKKFGLDEYRTEHANEDVKKLYELGFATIDLEEEEFDYLRVFQRISYKKGTFSFKWTDDMLPHILELKDKFVITDLTITSQFKSSFSWILYDYLKAHYGYWHKKMSKEGLMKLFGVVGVKSYQKNTSLFKAKVLDLAVKEINSYTELEIWYTEMKEGRSISGFELHWSTGKRKAGATENQLTLLREIHDEVDKKMFDYISLKDTKDIEFARTNIMKIKEINKQVNDRLTSEEAKDLIWEAKLLYEQLQHLLEKDGQRKDNSVYFNWLEGE